MLYKIILIYIILINIMGFILMGLDKKKSIQKKWRIKESTLLKTAIAGGCLGIWLGMKEFHHKTNNKKFSNGIPAIFVLHLLILAIIIFIKLKL